MYNGHDKLSLTAETQEKEEQNVIFEKCVSKAVYTFFMDFSLLTRWSRASQRRNTDMIKKVSVL